MALVLAAVPQGLRGDLTKWLIEVSAGVFVGRVSARIRDYLWSRVVGECREGRCILVYSSNSEQGFEFRSHNHGWAPTDFDGVVLMRRSTERSASRGGERRTGWSSARALQRARNAAWLDTGGSDMLPDNTR